MQKSLPCRHDRGAILLSLQVNRVIYRNQAWLGALGNKAIFFNYFKYHWAVINPWIWLSYYKHPWMDPGCRGFLFLFPYNGKLAANQRHYNTATIVRRKRNKLNPLGPGYPEWDIISVSRKKYRGQQRQLFAILLDNVSDIDCRNYWMNWYFPLSFMKNVSRQW